MLGGRGEGVRENGFGEGEVGGWAELAAVVASVSAHEDEGVWGGGGCACQSAEVADGVAGGRRGGKRRRR